MLLFSFTISSDGFFLLISSATVIKNLQQTRTRYKLNLYLGFQFFKTIRLCHRRCFIHDRIQNNLTIIVRHFTYFTNFTSASFLYNENTITRNSNLIVHDKYNNEIKIWFIIPLKIVTFYWLLCVVGPLNSHNTESQCTSTDWKVLIKNKIGYFFSLLFFFSLFQFLRHCCSQRGF